MNPRDATRQFGITLLVAGVLCAPIPVSGSGQALPSVSGNPTHGRDVFIEKGCLSCHAIRGSGGKVGPDLASALVDKGIGGIAAALLNHYPQMQAALHKQKVAPPVFSSTEMDDLIAYLLFINFARESGSAEKGRTLFYEKGCARCHWSAAGGQSVGPTLSQATLAAPPITVAQDMWNHGAQMAAKMTELHIPASRFVGHEMADLLAFLSGRTAPLAGHETALPGDPSAGRALFRSKGCARCHLGGDGAQAVGPDLAAGQWYKTATEIAGAMWNHGPAMWARMKELGVAPSTFADDDMANLIAYLYLLRSESQAGQPEQGEKVFQAKHCAHCHEAGGVGPDLTTAAQSLDTAMHVAAAMWNHAPRMDAFLAEAHLPWPAFDAAELRDLVGYFRTLRGAHPGN
jgi:cytochrome c2